MENFNNFESAETIKTRIQSLVVNDLLPKMHWIKDTSSHVFPVRYYCSNCGNDELYKTPFCPQCGAMEVNE